MVRGPGSAANPTGGMAGDAAVLAGRRSHRARMGRAVLAARQAGGTGDTQGHADGAPLSRFRVRARRPGGASAVHALTAGLGCGEDGAARRRCETFVAAHGGSQKRGSLEETPGAADLFPAPLNRRGLPPHADVPPASGNKSAGHGV